MRLLIWGVAGLGRTVIELVQVLPPGTYDNVGLIADDLDPGTSVLGLPILGGRSLIASFDPRDTEVCVAIVRPNLRKLAMEYVWSHGLRCATVIAPSAIVPPSAAVGEGCVLLHYAALYSGARLGRGVQVNVGGSVGHDSSIGDFCSLFAGARVLGDTHVGEGAWIGGNATVATNLSVGRGVRIEAGSAVLADLADFARVSGNPAEPNGVAHDAAPGFLMPPGSLRSGN